MAMVRISPTEVEVACDSLTGEPRVIRIGEEACPVLEIERVRDESAAYPTLVGPRTLFHLRMADKRLRLSYAHRSRRWLVDGLEPLSQELKPAA